MDDKDARQILNAKTRVIAATLTARDAWNTIPWQKLRNQVFGIQERIYQASLHNEKRTVQQLQKLLTKSKAARMLAVRKVTQDNRGKKTAGIDGVKDLSPKAQLLLIEAIHPNLWVKYKSKSVRRVWIEKAGKKEKRPLGIPTMHDRAVQALVKMALEPEWEARFEARSYGFRPGRSAQDAIEQIFNTIRRKPKFVYDADVKGCFDHINHQALLEKLDTYPAIKRLVKEWLKAGVLENMTFAPTEEGAPQGSVISPLLANIALHGFEEAITREYKSNKELPTLVRYADDFVIFHSDREKLEKAANIVKGKLNEVGLSINEEKTRTSHTLYPQNGIIGFNFLGFTIRQFSAGKTSSGKNAGGKLLGFKTIIKPSKKAVERHLQEIGLRIKAHKAYSQELLIYNLNPIIRGWTNYYCSVVAAKTFAKCDHIMFTQLWSWAKRRHANKGTNWIKNKYWHTRKNRSWIFATSDNILLHHIDTKRRKHIQIKGKASPYDGNKEYWSNRNKMGGNKL